MASGNASTTRPYRREQEAAEDDDGTECTSGRWCHSATRTADGDWVPARTFQPYCAACRGHIAGRLADLPAACVLMLAQIGERPRSGRAVRVPPGPREPIRLEIDALAREMALVLGSWHERVAQVARLALPDPAAAAKHPAAAVRDAEAVLSAHLDALLALPPGPVALVWYSPQAAEKAAGDGEPGTDPHDEGRVTASGEARMAPSLSGADAAQEILALHRRARRITGDVRGRPDTFDGVPCRDEDCAEMALERAEPPSDPARPPKHSRCAACGDEMTREEFTQWAEWYASWADGGAIRVCRRCSLDKPKHGECTWQRCACTDGEHPRRRAAA